MLRNIVQVKCSARSGLRMEIKSAWRVCFGKYEKQYFLVISYINKYTFFSIICSLSDSHHLLSNNLQQWKVMRNRKQEISPRQTSFKEVLCPFGWRKQMNQIKCTQIKANASKLCVFQIQYSRVWNKRSPLNKYSPLENLAKRISVAPFFTLCYGVQNKAVAPG